MQHPFFPKREAAVKTRFGPASLNSNPQLWSRTSQEQGGWNCTAEEAWLEVRRREKGVQSKPNPAIAKPIYCGLELELSSEGVPAAASSRVALM